MDILQRLTARKKRLLPGFDAGLALPHKRTENTQKGGLSMENLRLQAIEKMEGDMIFCFECDDEEKENAYNYIAQMSKEELIRFINE